MMKEKINFKKEPAFGGKEVPVKQTTRDKVEAWLNDMPNELILIPPVIEKKYDYLMEAARVTPSILDGGYEITLNFKSATWENDDE